MFSLRFFIVSVFTATLLLQGTAAFAEEEFSCNPETISFGTIDLHPAGDSVSINAQTGTPTLHRGQSLIDSWKSGKLICRSIKAGRLTLTYPENVSIRSESSTITLKEITSHSQHTNKIIFLPGGNKPVSIHIGGVLTLPKSRTQEGSYLGSIPITINFTADE